jgi:tetratricopeptide (TPR) repeat protein
MVHVGGYPLALLPPEGREGKRNRQEAMMGGFRNLAAAALLALSPIAAAGQSPVGEVAFENSGAPAAQAPFLRGLALLHNFEYAAAAVAFREAQAADPGFAMAYWGEAMTYNHPVWMEQDAAAARAVLARLGADRGQRMARARTERERLYLDAVETLYGEGAKPERDRLYSQRMEALFNLHPDDVDARAFYALSLLGLAHHGRDVPLYMRAAALLEEVYPDHLNHPGVLHYLIHSYDDPTHAPLGLRAARRYASVAPDAAHAIHMTSHIFLALGSWQESADANRAAMAVVNRNRAAAGLPPVGCGHAAEWLVYSEYQNGRPEAADAQVELCLRDAQAELAGPADPVIEPVRSFVLSYADMAVRQLIETGRWPGADAVILRQGRYLAASFTSAYGAMLAAAGDPVRFRQAHARLREAAAELRSARGPNPPSAAAARREEIVLMQAAALEQLHGGDAEAGLAGLRAAAEIERTIPAEFGPPLVEKPSHELLGDALLRLGRIDEARQAYQAALALAPGRRLSTLGLAAEQSAAR